jgi:predicted ribosomally synthesized peptide with SipW-like signal peptide
MMDELSGNKKVGGMILVVLIGALAVGVGSWALWSDTDASTSNTVNDGTMDLAINGSNNDVSGSFSLTDSQPGDNTSQTFVLENDGTTEADHVEIALSSSENDSESEPADTELNAELDAGETASLIRVTQYEYRNNAGVTQEDLLTGVNDSNGNGNGIIDLQDVQNQAGSADDLNAPQANPGNTTQLALTLEVADDDDGNFIKGGNTTGSLTGVDEDIMGDGVDITVEFTLNQEASQ